MIPQDHGGTSYVRNAAFHSSCRCLRLSCRVRRRTTSTRRCAAHHRLATAPARNTGTQLNPQNQELVGGNGHLPLAQYRGLLSGSRQHDHSQYGPHGGTQCGVMAHGSTPPERRTAAAARRAAGGSPGSEPGARGRRRRQGNENHRPPWPNGCAHEHRRRARIRSGGYWPDLRGVRTPLRAPRGCASCGSELELRPGNGHSARRDQCAQRWWRYRPLPQGKVLHRSQHPYPVARTFPPFWSALDQSFSIQSFVLRSTQKNNHTVVFLFRVSTIPL